MPNNIEGRCAGIAFVLAGSENCRATISAAVPWR